MVATFMISVFHDDATLQKLNDKLQVAFLIFPNYNLGKGLMDLSYYEFMNDYYRKVRRLYITDLNSYSAKLSAMQYLQFHNNNRFIWGRS